MAHTHIMLVSHWVSAAFGNERGIHKKFCHHNAQCLFDKIQQNQALLCANTDDEQKIHFF